MENTPKGNQGSEEDIKFAEENLTPSEEVGQASYELKAYVLERFGSNVLARDELDTLIASIEGYKSEKMDYVTKSRSSGQKFLLKGKVVQFDAREYFGPDRRDYPNGLSVSCTINDEEVSDGLARRLYDKYGAVAEAALDYKKLVEETTRNVEEERRRLSLDKAKSVQGVSGDSLAEELLS